MVSEALTDVGYHTVGRCDGDGLEEVLDGLRPDLVVLDSCCWGAMVSTHRRRPRLGRRRIVLITARDGLQDWLRGLDGGADDYVIELFELAELVSRVGAVLRRRGRLPQLSRLAT